MNTSHPEASGNGDGGYRINGTATNCKIGRATMTVNEAMETWLNLGTESVEPWLAKVEIYCRIIVPTLSSKMLTGPRASIDKAPIRTVNEALRQGISASPRPKSIGASRIRLPVNSLARYQPGNRNTNKSVTIVKDSGVIGPRYCDAKAYA